MLSAQEVRAQQDNTNNTDAATTLVLEEEPSNLDAEEGLQFLVPGQCWSFKALEENFKDDIAFRGLRLRFQQFFHGFLNKYTAMNRQSVPRFREDDEVSCARFLHIFYGKPKR